MRIKLKKSAINEQSGEDTSVFIEHMPPASPPGEDNVNDSSMPISLEKLKEQENRLSIAEKEMLVSLDQVRLQQGYIAEERSRLLETIDRSLSKLQSRNREHSSLRLFVIETSGPRFTDGMVFTVMAEDHVWAEHMVRQWLDSNGQEEDKIDKVNGIISNDVRAIVNVGSRLLDR